MSNIPQTIDSVQHKRGVYPYGDSESVGGLQILKMRLLPEEV